MKMDVKVFAENKKKIEQLRAEQSQFVRDFYNLYGTRLLKIAEELYEFEADCSSQAKISWRDEHYIYFKNVFLKIEDISEDSVKVSYCGLDTPLKYMWVLPFSVDEEKDEVLLEEAKKEVEEHYGV